MFNGAAVSGLNHAIDELTLFCWVNLSSNSAAVDLFWGQLRVAGSAGGIDDRHIRALNNLSIREEHCGAHTKVVTPRILWDAALLFHLTLPAAPALVVVRTGEEVAAAADQLALAVEHLRAAVGAAGHHKAWVFAEINRVFCTCGHLGTRRRREDCLSVCWVQFGRHAAILSRRGAAGVACWARQRLPRAAEPEALANQFARRCGNERWAAPFGEDSDDIKVRLANDQRLAHIVV